MKSNQELAVELLKKYGGSWKMISYSESLTEDFIREFKDKVDWWYISKYQKLSENFIREFRDKVDWVLISKYQKLSEYFIQEFHDKVDWEFVCAFQGLSIKAIEKYRNTYISSDIDICDIKISATCNSIDSTSTATDIKKYRKLPVEIEALQYDGYHTGRLRDFCGDAIHEPVGAEGYVEIETLEGVMRATKGDYIIKGVNGEFYPCKPDIFEKTYEEVI